MSPNQPQIPSTVDEAIHILYNNLGEKSRQDLRSMQRRDLFRLHYGYGMFVRIFLGLRSEDHPLWSQPEVKRLPHGGAISGYLIERLWEYVQENRE